MKKTLSNLGEFGLIRKIRAGQPTAKKRLIRGMGDDAAVFRPAPGKVIVVTTDLLVENIHFSREWASWVEIGEKALAVNLSDLAAMGAVEPVGYLVGLSLPVDTPVHIVDNLYQGLGKIAQKYRCALLGGDTVAALNTIEISITLFGEANPEELVYRQGAKPGDKIFVSGCLGGSAAGLLALKKGLKKNKKAGKIVQEHLLPQPKIELASRLAKQKLVNSMIDCSDGLDLSLKFIAEESGVGMKALLEQIPLGAETVYWAKRWGINPVQWALSGGEDYQLIFTVPPGKAGSVGKISPSVTLIGEVVKGEKISYLDEKGKETKIAGGGYDHFAGGKLNRNVN
ncbi:MAG: thiamine-phosphate kinase [Elusimicrobiota bacterium]